MTGLDLRNMRKSMGITQKQLADDLMITQPCLCKWERSLTVLSRKQCRVIDAALRRVRERNNKVMDDAHKLLASIITK